MALLLPVVCVCLLPFQLWQVPRSHPSLHSPSLWWTVIHDPKPKYCICSTNGAKTKEEKRNKKASQLGPKTYLNHCSPRGLEHLQLQVETYMFRVLCRVVGLPVFYARMPQNAELQVYSNQFDLGTALLKVVYVSNLADFPTSVALIPTG